MMKKFKIPAIFTGIGVITTSIIVPIILSNKEVKVDKKIKSNNLKGKQNLEDDQFGLIKLNSFDGTVTAMSDGVTLSANLPGIDHVSWTISDIKQGDRKVKLTAKCEDGFFFDLNHTQTIKTFEAYVDQSKYEALITKNKLISELNNATANFDVLNKGNFSPLSIKKQNVLSHSTLTDSIVNIKKLTPLTKTGEMIIDYSISKNGLESVLKQKKMGGFMYIDRSAKGKWTTINNYVAMKSNHGLIEKGDVLEVDMFETALFKYAVDMRAEFNGHMVTHNDIEEMVKIFEKNVNIGPSVANRRQRYFFTDYEDHKNVIEIFKSAPEMKGLSFGSEESSQINLISNVGIYTEALLLLHEYGHHETISDMKLYHPNWYPSESYFHGYIDKFGKLKEDMENDPYLSKFTKYFKAQGAYQWFDSSTKQDYTTPIGTIYRGSAVITPNDYVFSAPEMVTRMLMILQLQKTAPELLASGMSKVEMSTMYEIFKSSPLDKVIINKFVDLLLKDVYPVDDFASEYTEGLQKINTAAKATGIIATRNVTSKQIGEIDVTIKGNTFKVTKDQLKRSLGEYNFNTDFSTSDYERTVQVYMYEIDLSKLDATNAKMITDLVEGRAYGAYYVAPSLTYKDEEGNVLATVDNTGVH